MRKIHGLTWGLVAIAVVILPFGVAMPAGAEGIQQVVQVVQVKGQARFSNDNKTWHTLKKGEILQPDVMIQTAGKSMVDLQLGDQDAAPGPIDTPNGLIRTPEELKANTIRLYENSVLDIGKLTSNRSGTEEVSDTQLDLRAGRMMGGVRKSSSASRYEIKVLNGVAGVREGVFVMNSSGEVAVLYGMAIIALEAADGSTPVKIVGANHQFDPGTGLVTEMRSSMPVEPSNPKPETTPAAPLVSPSPGMGGALRKF
jgi:hypothetical protein